MPQSWPFLARPPIQSRSVSGLRYPLENAGVAQLAEQLFCKQQVTGSIPVAGSAFTPKLPLVGHREGRRSDQPLEEAHQAGHNQHAHQENHDRCNELET